MGVLLENTLSELLLVTSLILYVLYYYFTSKFDYFKKLGLPYVKPIPFFGNSKDLVLVRRTQALVFQDFYNSEELKDAPLGGFFLLRNPALIARDPDLIKDIMIKDFKHFSERGLVFNEKLQPLQAHLFNLGGWRWRVLRLNLTPTFTSGKMKQMFTLMAECTKGLEKLVGKYAKNNENFEIKEELAKFTTDIIGTCAFGLQINSMEDEDNEFRTMGRRIFEPRLSTSIKRSLISLFPFLLKFETFSFLENDINEFFLNVVKDTVTYREKNNVVRNDMLQLLMEIKNKGALVDEENKYVTSTDVPTDESGHQVFELTDKLLAAQVFVFFLAGFETSSTTMSFAFYELALNPDVQDKLAEEIQTVLKMHDDQITYDALQEMKYLDMVVSESLRKYPPVPVLFRKVTQNYQPPGTDIVIEAGNRIFIPVYALQRDPKYFPDPEKFDPTRFAPENKAKIHPMVYLPFGDGPRNCIGARFGLLQTKLGIVTILRKYKLEVCEKTLIPMKLDPKAFISTCQGGCWLKATVRSS